MRPYISTYLNIISSIGKLVHDYNQLVSLITIIIWGLTLYIFKYNDVYSRKGVKNKQMQEGPSF